MSARSRKLSPSSPQRKPKVESRRATVAAAAGAPPSAVATRVGGPIAGGPIAPEPEAGSVASSFSELADFALPPVVGSRADPEAPALPLDDGEPTPVSSIDPSLLRPDPSAIAGLRRLAGVAADPARCRRALVEALQGGPYDPRELPDTRAMLLGIARVLVRNGVPADALVQAIIDAMLE